MSKKYKFTRPWKRWNAGDVIDAYEYKRLPIEVKKSCVEEYMPEIRVPKIKNIASGTVSEKIAGYDPAGTKEKNIPKNPFSARTAWSADVEKDLET